MRQQPAQLVEVPWNEQTPEQRQQTLQRQRQAQQLAEQQRSFSSRVRLNKAGSSRRVRRKPRRYRRNRASLNRLLLSSRTRICCKPLRTRPRSRSRSKLRRLLVPLTRQNRRRRKKDERRWMVQCGSFRGAEQAETVRAQLAFEGFDSKNYHQQWLESCGHWPGERQRERRQHPQSLEDGGSYKLHSARRRGLKPSKSPPSIIALCPVLLYGVCTLYS